MLGHQRVGIKGRGLLKAVMPVIKHSYPFLPSGLNYSCIQIRLTSVVHELMASWTITIKFSSNTVAREIFLWSSLLYKLFTMNFLPTQPYQIINYNFVFRSNVPMDGTHPTHLLQPPGHHIMESVVSLLQSTVGM